MTDEETPPPTITVMQGQCIVNNVALNPIGPQAWQVVADIEAKYATFYTSYLYDDTLTFWIRPDECTLYKDDSASQEETVIVITGLGIERVIVDASVSRYTFTAFVAAWDRLDTPAIADWIRE